MNKKSVIVLALVAVAAGAIFLIYSTNKVGDSELGLAEETKTSRISVDNEKNEAKFEETSPEVEMGVSQQEKGEEKLNKSLSLIDQESTEVSKSDYSKNKVEENLTKYGSDYRNDLLTRFMQDDFEQFFEAKNLQVNQVQCEDAVCDIDFYSKVPLNNDEDLRNDLILDIAIKLQSEGLLSEQNQISDADNNFENIKFSVRMDEQDK